MQCKIGCYGCYRCYKNELEKIRDNEKFNKMFNKILRKAKLNDIGLKLIYHFRRRKQLKILQSAEVNKVLFDPRYIGGVIIKNN
jgi:hypothetical protein